MSLLSSLPEIQVSKIKTFIFKYYFSDRFSQLVQN